MKTTVYIFIFLIPLGLYSQQNNTSSLGLGIKAGLNFANVSDASSINSKSQAGFHAGAFLAPASKSILGSRTELIFSRQGYDYSTGTNSGSVNLDYVMLAQLLAINITKFVQIQLGGQLAYLLNAKADSSKTYNTGNPQANAILGYYNRIDYGYGVGVEVHPFLGLLVGARYNVSLSKLYKQSYSYGSGNPPPSFLPNSSSIDLKNNVVQLFAGYRF
jgi:hypothetical protein